MFGFIDAPDPRDTFAFNAFTFNYEQIKDKVYDYVKAQSTPYYCESALRADIESIFPETKTVFTSADWHKLYIEQG